MQKERIFAIVVGLLMIFSVAGFAASSFRFTGAATQGSQEPEEYTIPVVVDRLLSGQEIALLLGRGRVVIESVYNKDCEDCRLKDAALEAFAQKYPGSLVLESVETESGEGFEKFQMIGYGGRITSLEGQELGEESLFQLFCQTAVLKPRECLLLVYNQQLNNT